ncbi:MAG: SLBB domain-containing protein [Chitinispirillaceae bacterium]
MQVKRLDKRVTEAYISLMDNSSIKRKTIAGIILLTLSLAFQVESMSMEEMERQAREQGLGSEQIEEMKRRYGDTDDSRRKDSSQELTPTQKKWNAQSAPVPSSAEFNYNDTADNDTLDDTVETLDSAENDTAADSDSLLHFGYDLFSTTPEAFKPTAVGPVDPGYMVGPGDVLRVAVWGQTEFQYELTVDNEGKILIPIAGKVHVSGIPFEQLQEKLKSLLSRHYSTLKSQPPRTFMDLTIAKLRPIRVYIMGEVKQPGGYTVSSFASVFSALYSVGGPRERGSLREISVIRNDSTVATVDIYDYLLNGRSDSDVRLRNNDVIFVPPRGKTVSVSGSVARPAVYELKKDDNLKKLLSFSGGVLSRSNVERAQIHRVLPFKQRSGAEQVTRIVDVNISRYLEEGEDFDLHDGDSLHITPLFSDLRNFVTLSGAVQYPGTYQCDDLSLAQLVFKHGKLIDNKSFTKRADLIRLNEDKVTTTVHPIDLEKLKNSSSADQKMRPGDQVIVYDMEVEKPTDLSITVDGEVKDPGDYELSSNMTVADAILRAGGFNRKALKTKVDIYRPDILDERKLAKVFQVELPENLDYADPAVRKLKLQDRDRVVVRPDPNYKEDNYVTIAGLIKYAGTYALEERNERLSGIIERAGGLMPDAYLKGATISRQGTRMVVDFERAHHNNNSKEDVVLQKGDSIYIPSRPNSVLVEGQVNNEGLYGYIRGKHLKDYINRAGGLADSANYALVTLPNGETQRKGFGWWGNNPKIPDGSRIFVTKKPGKDPSDKPKGPSISEVIKDTLAIITSAVTVVVLVNEIK